MKEIAEIAEITAAASEKAALSPEAQKLFEKHMGVDVLPEKISYENRGPDGLTNAEKKRITQEVGWTSQITDRIRSVEEYGIYKGAGLKEAEIGGEKALIRNDIDWQQLDEKGRGNAERIARGLSPLDQNGNAIELHHIGQQKDSPLAELTFREHRCDGNDTILHDKTIESETHGEGNTWDTQRQDYWKNRAYNLAV